MARKKRPKGPDPAPGWMFDVEYDGIEIGRFWLPPRPDQPEGATTRQLVGPMVLWGESGRDLFWTELNEDEDEVPMIWVTESENDCGWTYALFNQADRFGCSDGEEGDDEDDDEDEGGEEPAATGRGVRRFVLLTADPPEVRTLISTGGGLEEAFGPVGSVGEKAARKLADAGAARRAIEERAAELLGRGYVEIVPIQHRIAEAFPPSRVEGDPGYWSRAESWEKVRDLMIPFNPSLVGHTPPDLSEEIAAFEAEWEFTLPPSYKAFLKVFGPGSARGSFFYLCPPDGKREDSIAAMTEGTRAFVASEKYDFVKEEYARLEPIGRMIFFCRDGGANQFGWDPDDLRDPEAGEYAILEWPHGWDYVEESAASFPAFFLDALLRDTRKRLGGTPEPTFVPDPPKKR